jgi:molybdate transport system permease protein
VQQVVGTTVALAGLTTLVLLVIAAPLGWWLASGRSVLRDVVAAVTALPVVLPPTVLGFYVLIALGPQSPLMALLHPFGVRTLAFTFTGLVIGSVLYSLPFAVQPVRAAFQAVGARPVEVAATLRASPLDTFFSVVLPLARRGFLTAAVLVFAHTVGEFGVVLMIGGAIPGRTEVVSIRIWRQVEALQFAEAHRLSAGLVAFAFVVLFALFALERSAAGRAR